MENTFLSTESFSRSWLVSYSASSDALPSPETPQKSYSTSFDAADEASFIELDPNLSASRRFYRVGKDFSFDFRAHESPVTLADAGELINDGLLLPLFTTAAADQLMKTEKTMCKYYYNYADETEELAIPKLRSSFSQKEVNSSNGIACAASLRRCKSVSKRIFHKYLDFIAPLCLKLRRRRSASRVASMNTQFDHCLTPATSSPAANSSLSANNYQHFLNDSERSISDAVLHCKRTNGMQYQLP